MTKDIQPLLYLIFTILISACNIIPEGATDKMPTNAYISSIVIHAEKGQYGGRAERDGSIYTIEWDENNIGLFKLNEAVAKSRIAIESDKLQSIEHFSASGSLLQSFSVAYEGDQLLKIIINTTDEFSITDNFFYKNGRVDSVARTTRLASGKTTNGFLKDASNFSLKNQNLEGSTMQYMLVDPYNKNLIEEFPYPSEHFQNIFEENFSNTLGFVLDQYNGFSPHSKRFTSLYTGPLLANGLHQYGSTEYRLSFDPIQRKLSHLRLDHQFYGALLEEDRPFLPLSSFLVIPTNHIVVNLEVMTMLYLQYLGRANETTFDIFYEINYDHQ